MAHEAGMIEGGDVEVVIEIDPDTGEILGWCATLRTLGLYECPLRGLDGEPRRCEECFCG